VLARLSTALKNGSTNAVVNRVKERLDESLAAILILNTFAHTIGAFGVGAQALIVFGPRWETLIAVLLTLAILYFSEIIPKTLGATFWRTLIIPASFLIRWLVKLVYPLVWVASHLTQITRLHARKLSRCRRSENRAAH
jgi:Mg2+/Co2+ transporter CorB